MRLWVLLVVVVSSPAIASSQNSAVCDRPFVWGVNGHPTQQAAYSSEESLDSQLNDLIALGATHYRVDLTVDTLGLIGSFPSGPGVSFDRVLQAATERGIQLLPVLTRRPDYRAPPEANFRVAYLIGRHFAARHGAHLCQIEAGNETEQDALRYTVVVDSLTGVPDTSYWAGTELSHYDPERLKVVLSFLGGLAQGIRKGAPHVQVVIDVAGRHYGFFEALQRAGVEFDIYGLHWYSDMLDGAGGLPAVLDALGRLPRPNLPVWITEVNRRHGSQAERPGDDQATWIRRLAGAATASPRVKAFFIYELLDQPASASSYGLVTCPAGAAHPTCPAGRELKPAFDIYRGVILDHQYLAGSRRIPGSLEAEPASYRLRYGRW